VSYVVPRSEVLASLLSVGALRLLLAAEDAATPARRAGAYLAAVAVAAAALAAKPVAATLPVAYLLHRAAFAAERSGPRLRRRLLAALPLVALSAAAAWLGLASSAGSSHAGLSVPGVTPGVYALTEARVVFRYLALLALPVGQNVDPDVAVSRTLLEPGTLAAAVALAALASAAVAALLRRPTATLARVAGFGVLWFLLLLLPTSLVPLADVMAEHRVYLASFGLFLAAAVALDVAAGTLRAGPLPRAAAVAVLLAALAAVTWTRNAVWETRVGLWTDATERSPWKPRPFSNLGWSRTQRGEHALALAAYRRALELGPDEHVRAEVLRNMGSSLSQLGRHAEATTALTAAAMDPDVEADARALLAISYLALRNVEAARAQVTRALRVDPEHGVARNTLGQVLLAESNPAAALEQFRIAVRLDPDSPARRYNVAFALQQLGRAREACAAWGEYLAVEGAPEGRQRAAAARAALGCGAP
jgi:Tfp pilus assembly protein PilF